MDFCMPPSNMYDDNNIYIDEYDFIDSIYHEIHENEVIEYKNKKCEFSLIAEHVWLLEKTAAPVKFLVFGNDSEVPRLWLARYGKLLSDITFYYLSDDGELTILTA